VLEHLEQVLCKDNTRIGKRRDDKCFREATQHVPEVICVPGVRVSTASWWRVIEILWATLLALRRSSSLGSLLLLMDRIGRMNERALQARRIIATHKLSRF
jgi:hypothetical protein